MIYVVAREVMLFSRWTVEYILGYCGMPLDVYCVLSTACLSSTGLMTVSDKMTKRRV